jgi:hypothetical protein
MFKKKSKNKDKINYLSDVQNRTRAFVLDSQIPHAHEISVALGCSPISDEGAAHEEEISDARVERIAYLIPLLYAYSKLLAEGSNVHSHSELKDALSEIKGDPSKEGAASELSDLSTEIWKVRKKVLEEFSFNVLMGAVSQLIDMDLLIIPKDKR